MKINDNFQWWMTKPNFFTSEECDEIIERVKSTEKSETGCIEPHMGSDHNLEFRSVTEWYLHKDMRDYAKGDYSDIQQKLFVAAKVMNQLSWNFNIQEPENNIKMIEYNSETEDFYTWHSDFNSGKSSRRKLTTIIQLTDPNDYIGGDLEMAIQESDTLEYYSLPKEKGTLLIFPSLLFHRVTPVTKGIRHSIQEFIIGDTFV
tara:strand:+ start:386 stop:994 length:609 start_codon:yes stop_codon:yes gene_type:complete